MAEIAYGPAVADDILTATTERAGHKLTDQFMNGNAMTSEMNKAGNLKRQAGGNFITEDLEYAANGTTGWVGPDASVSVSRNEILTKVRYSWAVLAGSVVLGDHENAKNAGRHQIHNLFKVRLNNVKNSMQNDMETALVGQTTPDANTVWSLIDIVDASDPTVGNLGDTDRDTYTWWQATEIASGSMATQGLEDIRNGYNSVSKGLTDQVNFHVTSQTVYQAYNARLTPHERIDRARGDIEFDHLTFHGKPVVFSEQMTSGVWLGLNLKYIKFFVNSEMEFKNQPFTRAPGGQSMSAVVQLMVQMVATAPKRSFKLTGMTA
jgi:hypothetical protein